MRVYITHVVYVERVYCVEVDDPYDLDLNEIKLGEPIAEIDTGDEPNEYEWYTEDEGEDKMPRYLREAISNTINPA